MATISEEQADEALKHFNNNLQAIVGAFIQSDDFLSGEQTHKAQERLKAATKTRKEAIAAMAGFGIRGQHDHLEIPLRDGQNLGLFIGVQDKFRVAKKEDARLRLLEAFRQNAHKDEMTEMVLGLIYENPHDKHRSFKIDIKRYNGQAFRPS